jgi:hypothetical protein
MMISMKLMSCCLFLSLLGCSSAAVYEGVRQGQMNECRQLPDAQQQKCFDRSPEDYQKYQQQLDELKK